MLVDGDGAHRTQNYVDRHLEIKFREEGFFFTSTKKGTYTNDSF